MKQKKLLITGIILLAIVTVALIIATAPKWSEKSFEAIVQETVIQPDGEVRIIVQRTTEIYDEPLNSLHIADDTILTGLDNETIHYEAIKPGDTVKITLKDSFIEENPFYYPTVFKVKVIAAN